MPITSPSVIVTDEAPDLLTRIRESASFLTFTPRSTVRCQGLPLFRTQAARDLACLPDVDPCVESWTCLSTALAYQTGTHVPDFAVIRSTESVLADAVPTDATVPPPWVPDAARVVGYGHEAHAEADLS